MAVKHLGDSLPHVGNDAAFQDDDAIRRPFGDGALVGDEEEGQSLLPQGVEDGEDGVE